ncbi:MAG TPA: hypothetical protein VGG01_01330 [Xanthobacteraceae bacterium]|jgi:hypothetical protein
MAGPVLRLSSVIVIAAAGLMLAGCSGSMPSLSSLTGGDAPPPQPGPPPGPPPRASIAPDDIVGRWGNASFHRPEDQARTEAAARNACNLPYVINRSSDGVAMLGHDNPQVRDMTIKASADGHTYIGPGPDPGSMDDREVVSFDGRVLILKWVDPEVAGRYGTMLLVRCPAPGSPHAKKKKKTT